MVEKALDRNRVALSVMLALTLVGAVIVATRNLDVETPQEIEKEPPVRIGVVSPKQENDPEYRFLARLAESEINAYCNESGIDCRFEFVFGCADGMPQGAQDETRRLHGLGANLSVGYGWSSQLCASYNGFGEEHGMTVISTGSTSPLSCCRKEDRAFRLHPYDGEVLAPAALMVHSLGVTDVVVLQRGDSWGDFISEGFGEEFEGLGGRIASVIRYDSFIWSEAGEYEGNIKAFLDDAESALKNVVEERGKDSAAVFVASFTEIAEMLRRAEGYPTLLKVAWFSPERLSDPSAVIENASEAAAGVGLCGYRIHMPDNPVHRRVDEAFQAEFGEPLEFIEANVYDGCWIMALSVIEANSTEGLAVYEALPDVAASYSGVTGRCLLNEYGDRIEMDYDIWGYFEVEGETQCLICGLYNSTTDYITWDGRLVRPRGGGEG
jgi:ABC-type branched-subunit amino acid transport system substrate-binding protein